MHEILTLQFGQRANYLATHFWNIQESYFTYEAEQESLVDHDVHFRQGVAVDGSDTYTPRTLIYDFKPAFGTLRQFNELYQAPDDQAQANNAWGGEIMSHRQVPIQQTEYQRHLNEGLTPPKLSSDSVRYWSDFNRVFYNPKSVVQIHESDLNPDQRAFDEWSHGQDLFETMNRSRDLFDEEMRLLVEECDQMQGVQVFSSVDDGWSGFTAKYMERVRDEMGKIPVWVWAMSSALRGPTRLRKSVNQARAVDGICEHATQYLPLVEVPTSLPSHMRLQASSLWSTTALQIPAVESLLLPTRLQGHVCSMETLGMSLNLEGNRKIAQVSFDVESETAGRSGGQTGDMNGNSWRRGVQLSAETPDGGGGHTFGRVEVDRAADLHDENHSDGGAAGNYDDKRTQRFKVRLGFPVLDSYPSELLGEGLVGVQASAATCAQTGKWIAGLEAIARRWVGVEEREELSNRLQEVGEAYRTSAEGDSDEDDWDG